MKKYIKPEMTIIEVSMKASLLVASPGLVVMKMVLASVEQTMKVVLNLRAENKIISSTTFGELLCIMHSTIYENSLFTISR